MSLAVCLFALQGCSKLGYEFISPDNLRGLVAFHREDAGFELSYGFPALRPEQYLEDLTQYYSNSFSIKTSENDPTGLTVSDLLSEVLYGSNQRSSNVLYVLNKSGALYPSDMPKSIDGIRFAVLTTSPNGHRYYKFYPSWSDIPVDLRKPDQWGALRVHVAYYDFPNNAQEIRYHVRVMIHGGSKSYNVDTTYVLQKNTYKSTYHLD